MKIGVVHYSRLRFIICLIKYGGFKHKFDFKSNLPQIAAILAFIDPKILYLTQFLRR